MYCTVCEKKQHKMLEFPLLEHPILETITTYYHLEEWDMEIEAQLLF